MIARTPNERKTTPLFIQNAENELKPIGYTNSKIIGIIYESARGEDIQEINQLINELNNDNKEVYSLKYITQSVTREKMSEISANTLKKYTLSKKDINLFRRPKKKSIRGFVDVRFDILIYMILSDIPPMHYLCSICNAKLKTAAYDSRYQKTYHLMVDIKEEKSLANLIGSIMKYLKMINQ